MPASLEESASRAGRHHWVETRLFEILGGWVPDTPEAEIKLLFDRHSQHHAWRAQQWWDRLPVLADVDRHSLSSAPVAVTEALAELAAVEGTTARLAGAYRVALPRLWAAYEHHRHAADPAADGAALRTLAIVAADVSSDWQEGELLLQALLEPGAATSAGHTVGSLEALMITAGDW